jgi:hypothetical protein
MYMSHPGQSRYAFARHPTLESSLPTTLTAQMPRAFVKAAPFQHSRQVPRNFRAKDVDRMGFGDFNKFQDRVEAFDFKPIFVPSNPSNFSITDRPKTLLAPPSPMMEDTQPDQFVDVAAIEADAMGEGMKKLKKGSPAMKAHMARLRGMRKKK